MFVSTDILKNCPSFVQIMDCATNQAAVVQRVDNSIHWTAELVLVAFIHWIALSKLSTTGARPQFLFIRWINHSQLNRPPSCGSTDPVDNHVFPG